MKKKVMTYIAALILLNTITGCAGVMDTTFKCLDATLAVFDCADGEEYSQDEGEYLIEMQRSVDEMNQLKEQGIKKIARQGIE